MLHAFQQLLTGNVVGARETVRELSERYPGLQLPPQLEALRQMPLMGLATGFCPRQTRPRRVT